MERGCDGNRHHGPDQVAHGEERDDQGSTLNEPWPVLIDKLAFVQPPLVLNGLCIDDLLKLIAE